MPVAQLPRSSTLRQPSERPRTMANTDLSSVILGTYGVIKPPPPPPVEERWWWQRVHHRKTGKHEKKFWWQQSTLNRRWLNGLDPPWRTPGHRSYHKKHHALDTGWWFEGPSLKEYHTHVPIQPQTRRLLQVLRRKDGGEERPQRSLAGLFAGVGLRREAARGSIVHEELCEHASERALRRDTRGRVPIDAKYAHSQAWHVHDVEASSRRLRAGRPRTKDVEDPARVERAPPKVPDADERLHSRLRRVFDDLRRRDETDRATHPAHKDARSHLLRARGIADYYASAAEDKAPPPRNGLCAADLVAALSEKGLCMEASEVEAALSRVLRDPDAIAFADFYAWQVQHHPQLLDDRARALLVDVLDGDAFAAEFAWWEPLLDGVVATLDEDERRVLGGEKIVVKDAAVACGCEAPGGSAAVAERRRAAARGRSLACCAAAP